MLELSEVYVIIMTVAMGLWIFSLLEYSYLILSGKGRVLATTQAFELVPEGWYVIRTRTNWFGNMTLFLSSSRDWRRQARVFIPPEHLDYQLLRGLPKSSCVKFILTDEFVPNTFGAQLIPANYLRVMNVAHLGPVERSTR